VRKVRQQIQAIPAQRVDLVERVDYDGAQGKVTITFHPPGIKTLADELARRGKEKTA
jgi:hypothetical protein